MHKIRSISAGSPPHTQGRGGSEGREREGKTEGEGPASPLPKYFGLEPPLMSANITLSSSNISVHVTYGLGSALP